MAENRADRGAAPVVLEMRGVTKRFGPVTANDDISLVLRRGEILGLLGENGAGKSTLMKILYGLYSPDSGEIFVDGQRVEIRDPKDAVERGIGMVHQHFTLIPRLTVAENVVLGAEPRKGVSLDLEGPSNLLRNSRNATGSEWSRERGWRTSLWGCSSGSRS